MPAKMFRKAFRPTRVRSFDNSNMKERCDMTNDFSESNERELTKLFYSVLKLLCDRNLVSHDPNEVEIIRRGRKTINPCARSFSPDSLDLRQLKYAYDNGSFWFLGPIQGLSVKLRSKNLNGTLTLTPEGEGKLELRAILEKLGVENDTSLVLSLADQSLPEKIFTFINN